MDEGAVKRDYQARGEPPEAASLALARRKASSVARPDALVIGGDQILVCGGDWFDKPDDLAAASAQLKRLRGREHRLVTSCVVLRDGAELFRHVAAPRLVMRDFSDLFLAHYLAAEGEAVLSAVGAYRLEGRGIQLFAEVDGEYGAILGLPILPLLGFLRSCGILPD